jgi:hypothetical protein
VSEIEPYTTSHESRQHRRRSSFGLAAVLAGLAAGTALVAVGTDHGSAETAANASAAMPTLAAPTIPQYTAAVAVPVATVPSAGQTPSSAAEAAQVNASTNDFDVSSDGGKQLTVHVTWGPKDGHKDVGCIELDRHTGLPGAKSCFELVPASMRDVSLLMVETGDPAVAVFGIPADTATLQLQGRSALMGGSTQELRVAVVPIDINGNGDAIVTTATGEQRAVAMPQLKIVADQTKAQGLAKP